MAISRLTSLTQEQYRALSITPFPIPPSVSKTGTPDPAAQIALVGWVGTDTIAFTVNNNSGTKSSLTIDTTTINTIDLNVTSYISPGALLSYWTVNMGPNAINSNWDISYDVAETKTNTGIWKFVKGKATGEDERGDNKSY